MLNGVIARRLQTLDEVLTELRSLGDVSTGQLTNQWRTRRAIGRDLQVLVEIVIDVCQRLISLEGQTPAATEVDAAERCIQLEILSDDDKYRKMVGLRNFIVRRYEHIDVGILADMVNHRLSNFEQFRNEVLVYIKEN